ncbi:MAG: SDR family NAD(P)-dependent oxidoreductase [Jatrophihabitans sp.]|nr:MAG: SDR family NAD(P)-dependent oxidoreductase [Jatrophihabitans sp.]
MSSTALVTGGGRGVGKGIALALGERGWTVGVTGRTRSRLDATAQAVTALGGQGIALECDHHDDAQVTATVQSFAAGHGALDLLVNNVWAGPADSRGFDAPAWERPLSDWDSLIGIGLRTHYVASVAACRAMVPARHGLIVNISSFGGRAHLHSVLYGISKAGLDKMAHDLAVELRPHGVRAVSLWPGLVQTESLLASGLEQVAGFPIADAETPRFVGRVVHALAVDPGIAARSGGTFVCAELARDYGITEDDGRQPASHRQAFGGGPFFTV